MVLQAAVCLVLESGSSTPTRTPARGGWVEGTSSRRDQHSIRSNQPNTSQGLDCSADPGSPTRQAAGLHTSAFVRGQNTAPLQLPLSRLPGKIAAGEIRTCSCIVTARIAQNQFCNPICTATSSSYPAADIKQICSTRTFFPSVYSPAMFRVWIVSYCSLT